MTVPTSTQMTHAKATHAAEAARRPGRNSCEPTEAALSGQVSVDLSAISDNIKALRKRTAAPHFMAVVKGNGYGHGRGRGPHRSKGGGR